MCVFDKAATKEKGSGEIDHDLMKNFLLLRTVVSAISNMGVRVLPTVQVLSEAKQRQERGWGPSKSKGQEVDGAAH